MINALLEFKRDYDANVRLTRALPELVAQYPARYGTMGLRDLASEMYDTMSKLGVAELLEKGFSNLPEPKLSPVRAYENLVRNNVERLPLAAVANRTLATAIVPYPPGIPLVMPGESLGPDSGTPFSYLRALEAFDRSFPGFAHDIHGIEAIDGKYQALCLTPSATPEAKSS